jgi:DNA-binding LytR/AlgR family response regulator
MIASTLEGILILEDEPMTQVLIKEYLIELGASKEHIYTTDKVEEGIDYLNKHTISLIFLDIALGATLDGVNFASIINTDFHIPFIYITGNRDKITIQRMARTNPKEIIIKPVEKYDIHMALNKILPQKNAVVPNKASFTEEKIIIKSGTMYYPVFHKDILYIEANGRYCDVFTTEERILSNESFKSLNNSLLEHSFIQIARSCTVNKKHVNRLDKKFVHVGSKSLKIGASFSLDILESF